MFDVENFYNDNSIAFITEGTKHCQAGWVQTSCPFCTGNFGHHLGYNLSGDFFNCWRCGFHPTGEVVKALTNLSWGKVKAVIKEYQTGLSTRKHLIPTKSGIKADRVKMPTGIRELTPASLRYLRKRGFDPGVVSDIWDLRSTGPVGRYKHRIIAPIYFNKTLVSYQGRDYTDRSDLKYKACPQELEVIDHKKILYGYDLVPGDKCVLVEGVTDAWRLGPGAVACFGIKTKPSQILLLAEKFRKVYVMFDDDPEARNRGETIGYDLSMCGVSVELCLIDGDPGGLKQHVANRYMEKLLG